MVNQSLTGFEEVIKCVIVGDSGVGKTCLSCAYACNAQYNLQKLVKTHQATVWATDHYQHDREILDRSWCDIDGCQVSIRLWDTFGYHDKDRRFAYRGADVIVLCFSVMSPVSLKNVHRIWHPEIRRFSPGIPIVLCGTQADLRYMCHDENYLSMEKGLLYRHISPEDLITPSVGREVARDISAPYYETSVLTHFGVQDVFINAARAALLERRKIKFWNTQLRRIQRPLLQPPMKMPIPTVPRIQIAKPLLKSDISALLTNKSECDVTFLVGHETIEAHRICLTVASTFFQDLFSLESLAKLPARRRRKNSHLRRQFPKRFSHTDSEFLLDSDQESLSTDTDYDSSVQGSAGDSYLANNSTSGSRLRLPLIIPYDHRAVELIEIRYEEDAVDPSHRCLQTYVRMCEEISARSFHVVIEYLYTGSLRPCEVNLAQVRKTADLLQLTDLVVVIDNVLSSQDFLNIEMDKQFHEKRIFKLRELALHKDFLSDITFEVDNGLVSAHKALLMGRCEMMYAMFSSDFIESASDVIPFPGITEETFQALQEYLYTGESPNMDSVDCLALIEVANRLCLQRLVNMVEARVVTQLAACEDTGELLTDALTLIQPAELYNASQLSHFCQHILCVNFQEVVQKYASLFHALPQDKQEAIEQKRWPPVWYLKELERYDRLTQSHSLHGTRHAVQDYNSRCGCLCFSRRRRHRLIDPVELPI
ncbi:rho-related BTB domain-containing protein 2 [Aplysia californica]|uniref:Rho-related BTB domain-containing protein 2 n=1 Tax=Aplysia californica TaxID=6500 RepID=A0ABM0JDE8_APLCA|nr:rho-related BTB domain-containing protein 2 [Aplysia californica]XP_005091132.1 rho-related BTB domain-containing protein 2 [Aplysia californica]XP_035828874.1 rho-related BTB domain-containing protein 2 [Aplysia californica]XP_035828876.1 rho-related BTB domain-containing protein 2 [Aplysia californica]